MKSFIFFVLMLIPSYLFPQTKSNDEINLERYWYLRSELRNRFVLQGKGTGHGQPASHIEEWGWPDNSNWKVREHRIHMGDATIELGWYWQLLATEYYLLKTHGESTIDTKEELYYSLQAFNRLDSIAELMWEGGNSVKTKPIWDSQNEQWTMGGKNITTISNDYISNNINSTTAGWMDVKNGNVGVLNGFFVRSDIPNEMCDQFYNFNKNVRIDKIFSAVQNDKTTERATEMSKDQLMHILLGLAVITKFVDNSASYNGHNLKQMAIDIGDRLYHMFRKYNGTFINENPWFIRNPCNTDRPFHVLTLGADSTKVDASRCFEFSTGLAAIFDYIIDGDIYYPVSDWWWNLYSYHQNWISNKFGIGALSTTQLWENMPYILGVVNSTIVFQGHEVDLNCIKSNFQTATTPSALFSSCISTKTMNLFNTSGFGTHMALCLAAGGSSWPGVIGTDVKLYNFGNSLYNPARPNDQRFPIYYLIHKALYPGRSIIDLWDPAIIESEINKMRCDGPYLPHTGATNTTMLWQSVNRWHSANPEKDFRGEYAGIDFMVLYNLYRIIYNSKNTYSSGNQLGYRNLLDVSISKNYPEVNGNGDQQNPITHYVFEDLTANNVISTPIPPTGGNYNTHAGDITYIAGWSIKLTDGFKAQNGVKFTAKINHEVCSGTTGSYPNLLIKDLNDPLKKANPITPEIANLQIEEDKKNDKSALPQYRQLFDSTSKPKTSSFNLSVFPNPTTHYTSFNISFIIATNEHVSISISDVNGRVIKQIISRKNYSEGSYSIPVNSSNLKQGVYFIRYFSEQNTKTVKLVVK